MDQWRPNTCGRNAIASKSQLPDPGVQAANERIVTWRPEGFLHFEQRDSGFLTWDTWFAKVGVATPVFHRRETFDVYPFLLHAVLDGEGIALGW